MIYDVLFAMVLVYASIMDVRTRTVQNGVWITIVLLGLFTFQPNSITGALLIFVPMLLIGLWSNLGGGDIKLSGACGFYLGLFGIWGLLIGAVSACIIMPVYCWIRKRKLQQTAFPFVPFLSFGFILIAILF